MRLYVQAGHASKAPDEEGTGPRGRAFPLGSGRLRDSMRRSLAVLFALALGGCAATATEMRRAEEAYEQARFDAARTWLVDLEDRAPSMDEAMRARYFYLRGMAEYRVGHRLDALHYLAVARELTSERATALREEQQQLLDRTLTELTPREPLTHMPPADGP